MRAVVLAGVLLICSTSAKSHGQPDSTRPFALCLSSCFTGSMDVGTNTLRQCIATARGQENLCQMEAYACLINCVQKLAPGDRSDAKSVLLYKQACERARRVARDPETTCAELPKLD